MIPSASTYNSFFIATASSADFWLNSGLIHLETEQESIIRKIKYDTYQSGFNNTDRLNLIQSGLERLAKAGFSHYDLKKLRDHASTLITLTNAQPLGALPPVGRSLLTGATQSLRRPLRQFMDFYTRAMGLRSPHHIPDIVDDSMAADRILLGYQRAITSVPPARWTLADRAMASMRRDYYLDRQLPAYQQHRQAFGPAGNLLGLVGNEPAANLSTRSQEERAFITRFKVAYAYEKEFDVPDIVFRPESGLVFGHGDKKYVFLGNFASDHNQAARVAEAKFNKQWFQENGFTVIELPEGMGFESSDVKYVKNDGQLDLLFGYGFRTDEAAVDWIEEKIKEIVGEEYFEENISIIKLKGLNDHMYHLDVGLQKIPTIEEGRIVGETVLYYPGIMDDDSLVDLEGIYPEAVTMSENDFNNFAANSVVIGQDIIMDARIGRDKSSTLIQQLEARGLTVHLLEFDQFWLAGGGFKCATLELTGGTTYQYGDATVQVIERTDGVFDVNYAIQPYMLENNGRPHPGRTEAQHKAYRDLLQTIVSKYGGQVHFLPTNEFRRSYHPQTFYEAIFETYQTASPLKQKDLANLINQLGTFAGVAYLLEDELQQNKTDISNERLEKIRRQLEGPFEHLQAVLQDVLVNYYNLLHNDPFEEQEDGSFVDTRAGFAIEPMITEIHRELKKPAAAVISRPVVIPNAVAIQSTAVIDPDSILADEIVTASDDQLAPKEEPIVTTAALMAGSGLIGLVAKTTPLTGLAGWVSSSSVLTNVIPFARAAFAPSALAVGAF